MTIEKGANMYDTSLKICTTKNHIVAQNCRFTIQAINAECKKEYESLTYLIFSLHQISLEVLRKLSDVYI